MKDAKELNLLVDNIPSVASEAEYKRDTSYLAFTVKEYIENDYENFHYVYMYGKTNYRKINIRISDVFYSPDKLKLIAFVVLEIPVYLEENKQSLENPNIEYFYDGDVLIAIRDSVNMAWDVYCTQICRSENYSTYEKVQNILRKFFLKEFKNQLGHGYRYNLNDLGFWTDADSLWRKGNVIHGYYDFQINTNTYYYQRDKNKEDLSSFLVPRLKIEYPKDLLEQYK